LGEGRMGEGSWEMGDFVQIENSKFQSIKLEFGIFLLGFYF